MEFHTKSKLHHFTLREHLQRAVVSAWAQCKLPFLIKPEPAWEPLSARTFLKQDCHSRDCGDAQAKYFFSFKHNADLKPLSPRDF